MRYVNKRGRPRVYNREIDKGTDELQTKRKLGITQEPLDLCLKRNFINADQHWAGIHFRWLHNIRYGISGVRSIDPSHLGGMNCMPDDIKWRRAREVEYTDINNNLKKFGYDEIIADLCVHNERPNFLRFSNIKSLSFPDYNCLKKTRRALNILLKLTCAKK